MGEIIRVKKDARNEISIGDIGYREVTLETVFLTLTGRSLRE
nr:hypothetical protein [Clostridium paraputrificum]